MTGQLKGRLFLRKQEGDTTREFCYIQPQRMLLYLALLKPPSGVEFPGVTMCKIRLYVVSASNLVIKDTSHACDAYVCAVVGKQKVGCFFSVRLFKGLGKLPYI